MPVKSVIGKFIKKLAGLNYYSSKALYKYGLYRSGKRFTGPPLLVYQMGKVGSSSVMRSLEVLNLDMPIYHTHGLSNYYIKRREKQSKEYFRSEHAHFAGITVPWQSEYIRKIIESRGNRKCKVITLVRDPIARKVSSFFQRIHMTEIGDKGNTFKIISYTDGYEFTGNLNDMEGLARLFVDISIKDINKDVNNDEVMSFFGREFEDVLGIDVYKYDFPKSKGYKIYSDTLADVLLIRLENLNECCQKAFKEFLDIDGFDLLKSNIGGEKAYSPIYRAFKKYAVLPDLFIDLMYGSKYAKHFYSREEINQFKLMWQNK